jgi:hypothetical protein
MSKPQAEILPPQPNASEIDEFLRQRDLVVMIRNLVNDWQRANGASDLVVFGKVGHALAAIAAEERRPAVRAALIRKFAQELPNAVEALADQRFEAMQAAGHG